MFVKCHLKLHIDLTLRYIKNVSCLFLRAQSSNAQRSICANATVDYNELLSLAQQRIALQRMQRSATARSVYV